MALENKRILLISPEPWEGIHMSKHHLAQALVARGNTVVFLNPPKADVQAVSVASSSGMLVATYRHWFKGINRMPRFVHMGYYRWLIAQVATKAGGPFDMLWCFDTSRMQWFPEGMGYKLLHLADYNILHQGMGLVRTADLVLATGEVVKEHVEDLTGVPVVNVGHGLDERWCKNAEQLHLKNTHPPRTVVYAGQLAMHYHDWEAWSDIATAHPELSFKLIGPFDERLAEPAFHNLRKLPNVQFIGPLCKDELIPEVRAADILFFGFRSATLAKERANPHKVLEYLSTGNVIVGSYTMEYADRPRLLSMAEKGASLLDTFNDTIARYHELNSPEARAYRIAFAQRHTLDHLLGRIQDLIEEHGH